MRISDFIQIQASIVNAAHPLTFVDIKLISGQYTICATGQISTERANQVTAALKGNLGYRDVVVKQDPQAGTVSFICYPA